MDSGLITQKDLIEMLPLSRSQFFAYAKEGIFVKSEGGLYRTKECITKYYHHKKKLSERKRDRKFEQWISTLNDALLEEIVSGSALLAFSDKENVSTNSESSGISEVPDYISTKDLLHILSFEPNFSILLAQGVFKPNAKGLYHLKDSIKSYTDYIRANAYEKKGSSLDDIKKRKEEGKARLIELKCLEAEGKVVNKQKLKEQLITILKAFSSKWTAIPYKAASQLYGLEKAEIQKELTELVNEALEELSRATDV
jgi:phage terminase Nu1 subunit (DNA packaging protein)